MLALFWICLRWNLRRSGELFSAISTAAATFSSGFHKNKDLLHRNVDTSCNLHHQMDLGHLGFIFLFVQQVLEICFANEISSGFFALSSQFSWSSIAGWYFARFCPSASLRRCGTSQEFTFFFWKATTTRDFSSSNVRIFNPCFCAVSWGNHRISSPSAMAQFLVLDLWETRYLNMLSIYIYTYIHIYIYTYTYIQYKYALLNVMYSTWACAKY